MALSWHWSHFDCLFGKEEEEEEEVVLTSSVCLCAPFLEKIVHFLGLRCLVGLLFVFLSTLFGFLFGVFSLSPPPPPLFIEVLWCITHTHINFVVFFSGSF